MWTRPRTTLHVGELTMSHCHCGPREVLRVEEVESGFSFHLKKNKSILTFSSSQPLREGIRQWWQSDGRHRWCDRPGDAVWYIGLALTPPEGDHCHIWVILSSKSSCTYTTTMSTSLSSYSSPGWAQWWVDLSLDASPRRMWSCREDLRVVFNSLTFRSYFLSYSFAGVSCCKFYCCHSVVFVYWRSEQQEESMTIQFLLSKVWRLFSFSVFFVFMKIRSCTYSFTSLVVFCHPPPTSDHMKMFIPANMHNHHQT